jgi:hypothetical protein
LRGASLIDVTRATSSKALRRWSGSAFSDWCAGYEDLNNHDELRKDPVFAVLAGKLKPVLRTDCEPVAGKSTLNRLEHKPKRDAARHHKIDCNADEVDAFLADVFVEAAGASAAADRDRCRRDRHPAARPSGGPVLPQLLRQLARRILPL